MGSWPSSPVLGHGFADAGPYPVPLQLLLVGAGVAVVAAAALSARTTGEPAPALVETTGPRAQRVLRILAVLLLAAIVLPAALGSDDVAQNPATRLLFTVAWAGLLLLSALVGPLWTRANPLRWAEGHASAFDARIGMWPAVAGLLVFSIAEQVLEPSPLLVLILVAVYVLGTLVGVTLRGGAWFGACDPVDRASFLLGRLALFGRGKNGLARRRVRDGLAATVPVAGMAAFLGVLIATSAYDAAAPENSFGTRLVIFLAAAAAAASVLTAAARPAYLVAAFIPAAASHVGAHYLAPLLVDTQIAAVQASDPFGLGWNLLGLTGSEIVAEPISPFAGLTFSYLLLVAGHALAMVVAKDLAAPHVRGRALNATLFPVRAAILASLAAGVFLRMGGA